jgi:hypothetical protein
LLAVSALRSVIMPRRDPHMQIPVPPGFGEALDEWRRYQPDIPSRPQAVVRLAWMALRAEAGARAVAPGVKAQKEQGERP